MKRITSILLLTVVVHLLASADEIHPDAATRTDRALPAITGAGDVQLAAREVQVEIVRPDVKNSKGALLVVFDQSSGLFARRFTWIPNYPGRIPLLENFSSYSRIYLTSDRLVLFTNTEGGIYIREFSGKATSLDDAESKALNDSVGDLTDYVAKVTQGPGFSFDHHLGQDFSFAPRSSFRGQTKLVDVSRRDGKWEITVVGRWKARVILTDKFEVTATERVQ
jgi:hypothetical protein